MSIKAIFGLAVAVGVFSLWPRIGVPAPGSQPSSLEEGRTFGIPARDYRLEGVGNFSNPKPEELAEMRKWAEERIQNGHLDLRETPFKEAPEHVLFNWASVDENLANLTRGIEKKNVKSILEKKRGRSWGLYAMADPYSSAHFGEILMEISVFKDRFPTVNGDGQVTWSPVQRWQYSLDPTARLGAGDMVVLKGGGFKTDSYLIQDLRAIKQLRFPNKKIVLGAWFGIDLKKPELEEALVQTAEQWLLTPNYSLSERTRIMDEDRPRFLSHTNRFPESFWDLKSFKGRKAVANLRFDGVMRLLFQVESQVVDFETGAIDYSALKAGLDRLEPGRLGYLKEFAESLKDSRLKRTLGVLLNLESENLSSKLEELRRYLVERDRERQHYSAHDPSILKRELKDLDAATKTSGKKTRSRGTSGKEVDCKAAYGRSTSF